MITTENYREIYNDLVEETNDFTSDSGVIKCSSKKASDIIREILSGYYGVIDYGISDIEDVDGNVYMIIYNDLLDTDIMESLKLLDEKIVKKGSKWQVQSEKGRNMGTYDSKADAEERLRQVEYFKHKNESIDDNFKLNHSLLEDIPTFWEWVDDQGLDPDVVEDNPDLEEYFRQQYDITYNFKTPEDYDLLDTDVPDDYDDFDFYHEEKPEPLDYHFVCYYEDDDSPGDQTGDAETLDDAIKMCKGYIDKYNYDCAEIFGPKGGTVATFWEGKWNTDYGESLKEDVGEVYTFDRKVEADGKLPDSGGYKVTLVDPIHNISFNLYWYKNNSYMASSPDYIKLDCDDSTLSDKLFDKISNFEADYNCWVELRKAITDCLPVGSKVKFKPIDVIQPKTLVRYSKNGYRYEYPNPHYKGSDVDESLDETLSGLKSKKKLDILRELKKDPNYKEDPRWKQFEDELINFYRVDPSEADIDTALYYTEFDWIDANLAMESLEEDKLKFSPNYNPVGTPLGKGTGLGEDYYDEENEVMIYSCPNCGTDLEWLGTQGKYEEYKCPECGEYFYDEGGKLINSAEIEESLNEGARSGIHQVSLKLNLLKELKKNPNYREDPRWEKFADVYTDIDEAIEDTEDYLLDLQQDRKWESLDEAKNDTLNPALWENDELKPEVKEKLQLIADKFIEKLKEDDIPLDVDDIVIVGSNRNYNYGPKSDIDLHIIADLSQFKGREKELAEKIYQCKKSIFNDKYDPMINGLEVELYVEPAEDKNKNDIPDEVE